MKLCEVVALTRLSKRTGPARRSAIRSRRVVVWGIERGCEPFTILQVGAATRALCGPARSEAQGAVVRCASLKSNMGHLEAAAAAAGLSSLVAGPLLASVVAVNAQLRRLVFELA